MCEIEPEKYSCLSGVPDFEALEIFPRKSDYCLLIPVINEGERIKLELERIRDAGIGNCVDVLICDGGSTDGSMTIDKLKPLSVNSLLVKTGPGKQGAQLRIGMYFALYRGYSGVVTVDGNNKDSVEDIPNFIDKLKEGFDFIQGSRYLPGGNAVNTPLIRHLAGRLIHAPMISLTAGQKFTDSTNNFRAYSNKYLSDARVSPLRDIFTGYELLAYLSVRASQLGMKCCEIPVSRVYPKAGKTPTKISFFRGNFDLLKILINNMFGKYAPKEN